jgi:hypothetical protein
MKFKKGQKVILLNDVEYCLKVFEKYNIYTIFDYNIDGKILLWCTKNKNEFKNNLFPVDENIVRKRTFIEVLKNSFNEA